MIPLSSFNSGIKCLLCVINVVIKCVWVKLLIYKAAKAVLNIFSGIVNQAKRKPSKWWIDKEDNLTITLCKNG